MALLERAFRLITTDNTGIPGKICILVGIISHLPPQLKESRKITP